jgi:hypothetical protein
MKTFFSLTLSLLMLVQMSGPVMALRCWMIPFEEIQTPIMTFPPAWNKTVRMPDLLA